MYNSILFIDKNVSRFNVETQQTYGKHNVQQFYNVKIPELCIIF